MSERKGLPFWKWAVIVILAVTVWFIALTMKRSRHYEGLKGTKSVNIVGTVAGENKVWSIDKKDLILHSSSVEFPYQGHTVFLYGTFYIEDGIFKTKPAVEAKND